MQKTARSTSKFYVILLAAFLGMGMSMPSCPGQQAMQQQIDTLTQQNAELMKHVQGMDGQVKMLNKDMGDVKSLLKPIADTVQAQKTSIDQLDANLKEIQSKMTASKSKTKGKPAAKKGR
jgi:septal ring factor EnvC (AmiA/AmiB activator)